MSILIIEDEENDYLLLKRKLEAVAHTEIIRASTLAEALAKIAEKEPTMIVADLNLSDSHGLDTLRRVKLAAPHALVSGTTGALITDEMAAERVYPKGDDSVLLEHIERQLREWEPNIDAMRDVAKEAKNGDG